MRKNKMKTNLKIRILLIVVIGLSTVYSNQVLGQCNANSLSPSTINAPGSGGQYSVSVNTGGCTTYNISNYTGFATYSKNGLTVTVTVPSNTGSSRSGTMMIGNKPLSVNQACGSPTAPSSISSNYNGFCSGAYSTITLTASGGSGDVLTWFSGSCGGTTVGTGNNLQITAPTSTTIYYARWGNSCTNSACSPALTVTVYSRPTPVVNTGAQSVCAGAGLQSYTTQTGMSNYSWSVSGGGYIQGSSTSSTVNVNWTSAGNWTLYLNYSNSYGCSSTSPTAYGVTVIAPPVPTLTGPTSVCVGTTGSVYSTDTGKTGYIWTVSSGGTITSGTTSSSITVTWSQATGQQVTVSYTGNSCGAAYPTVLNVDVHPRPSPTIQGSSSVCNGATGVNYYTETGQSGYSWSVTGGTITSGLGSSSIYVTWSTVGTQTVSVNYTNTYSCSAVSPATKSVTVNPLPAPSISGSTSVCAGSGWQSYTAQTGFSSYTWSVSGGGYITTGQGTNTVNVNWTTGGQWTVYLTCTNSYGCTNSPVSYGVSVIAPPVPSLDGTFTVCEGTSGVNYTTDAGKTNYTWTVSAGGTITSSQTSNSITVTWNTYGPQSVTVSYKDGLCTAANPTNKSVTVNPRPAPAIDGSSSVCAGTTGVTYTTATGMTGYTWSVTGGTITSGLGTNSITVTWTTAGQQSVSLNYTNNFLCTAATPTSKTVTVNSKPTPTIDGATSVCAGAGWQSYTTQSGSGITGYVWSVSGGGNITTGQGTNMVNVNWTVGGAQTVSVNYTNSSGCTATSPTSYPVTVYARPVPELLGPLSICDGGATIDYSTDAGKTGYTWTVAGGNINSGSTSNVINVTWNTTGPKSVSISYTDTHCTAAYPTNKSVEVYPAIVPPIDGLVSVCSNSTQSYTTSTGMTNYSWTVTGGDITAGGGSASNMVTVRWGVSGTGHVKVNYDNAGGCTAPIQSDLPVTVNAIPLPQIEGPTATTLNSTGNVYTTQSDMSSYTWNITGGSITSGGGSSNNTVTVTWTGPCSGDIRVNYTSAEGCPGVTQTVFPVSIIRTGSSDQNYINTRIAREAFQNSLPDDSDPLQVNSEYTYFDGLGRPIQTVQVKGSPLMNDVVTHIEYDQFGRQKFDYLPYSKSDDPCNSGAFVNDAANDQLAFYFTNLSDSYPFAEKVLEDSPLDRVMEQGAPGSSWQVIHDVNGNSTRTGNTVRYEYGLNGSDVYLWKCDESNDIPRASNYYSVDEPVLFRTRIYDENGSPTANSSWTEEYKDKEGRVVLKKAFDGVNQLSTYYVYDDFGLLRYVIPPATSFTADGNTSIVSQGELSKYCYIYKYDSKKRMVVKKLPGADSVLMVYDLRDRLVATQDGVQRDKSNQNDRDWSFIKYDYLNRPVSTGIIQSPNTRIQMQAVVDVYTTENLYEDRSTSSTNYYFTDKSFPNNTYGKTYLTLNYYDNYDCNNNGTADYSYTTDPEFPDNYSISNLSNKPTVIEVRQLDPASSSEIWITSANFYDKYYRIIQTQSSGIQGGTDVVTNQFNFAGLLTKSKQTQSVAQGATNLSNIVRTRIDYDHKGRVLKNYYKINNDPEVTLTSMHYNELSQLATKKLHVTNDVGLQKIDYTYNIRGWLRKINEPDLSGSDNDFFGIELLYDAGLSALDGSQQYNGNISGMKWKSGSAASVQKAYGFSYDQLNRLLNARYAEGTAYDQNVDRYKEACSYDKNGNIQSVVRKGQISTGVYGDLDVLSYDYTGMGNQVRAIGDAVADVAGRGDFYDFTPGNNSREYYYDKNGNMWLDRNKHLKIAYNQLNLPKQINDTLTTSFTQYVYTAAGQKIKQRLSTGGTSLLYDGNIVYSLDGSANGILVQYIITPEGRVTNSSGTYTYEYNLKDHLGNTRLAFNVQSGSAVIVQQDDYYPFGMLHKPQSPNNDNKYLYNGKELQQDMNLNWYDYGARFYDPQIGRWTTPDPLAEKYRRWSPYTYGVDNPIRFKDPDGMQIWIGSYDSKGAFVQARYSDGKLYNEKGTEYTGNNSYILKVAGQLNEIKGMDKDVNKMVSNLESSKNNHTIRLDKEDFKQNGSNNSPEGVVTEKTNENGEKKMTSGSKTNFDPNATENIRGEKDDPRAQLAHELSHASDNDNGTRKQGTTKNGVELNEVDAVNVENKIRTNPKVGMDKRTDYSGREIPKELLK
jgi:RHS repeat-associated protein